MDKKNETTASLPFDSAIADLNNEANKKHVAPVLKKLVGEKGKVMIFTEEETRAILAHNLSIVRRNKNALTRWQTWRTCQA